MMGGVCWLEEVLGWLGVEKGDPEEVKGLPWGPRRLGLTQDLLG